MKTTQEDSIMTENEFIDWFYGTSEQSLVSYIRSKQATAPAKKTRKRRK